MPPLLVFHVLLHFLHLYTLNNILPWKVNINFILWIFLLLNLFINSDWWLLFIAFFGCVFWRFLSRFWWWRVCYCMGVGLLLLRGFWALSFLVFYLFACPFWSILKTLLFSLFLQWIWHIVTTKKNWWIATINFSGSHNFYLDFHAKYAIFREFSELL